MFPVELIVVGVILVSVFASAVKVLSEYERGVVLRLGRFVGIKGPGLILLIPYVDKMVKVDMRTITMDVPPQDVITKDNVSLKMNAVVYFRVVDPNKAVLQIENYYFAASQLAQTTLRSVMGQVPLDEALTNRDDINRRLQDILDHQTEAWGIKVALVEVKQIDLPESMQRAMAKEAEAERERRAKIISAEGEVQRASRLREASDTLGASSNGMQLAYLQTLQEIGSKNSNTIIFPVELLGRIVEGFKPKGN
jgi:regulator of protease activity HflC (stomatin/prohibitin superfamily)